MVRVVSDSISVSTRGGDDMIDLTPEIEATLRRSELRNGTVTVFVSGSTAGISTIEFEPGLRRDLPEALERLAPRGARYRHDDTWHDGNGHSHVRATLLGPSLTIPFSGGRLLLGTWQQVVLVDFDNRPRNRSLAVQMIGE